MKYGNILTPQKYSQASIFAIYGRMARSDAWKLFLWIFQDFTFLHFEKLTFVKHVETVSDTWLEFVICG